MSQPFIGEIRIFAGNFAPLDWAFCNGQLIAISDNSTLFNLIGTTYGGDGITTFALPDLQCRMPMHAGSLGGTTAVLAQTGGRETVQLDAQHMPSHSHTALAQSARGNAYVPGTGTVWASSGNADEEYSTVPQTSNAAGMQAMNAAIGSAGGTQAHDNMPPFVAMSFIIALYGIYPSQN